MPAQPSSSAQTAINIRQAHIRPSGTPWIRLSSGASYAYNGDFQAWEEMCNTWLAESSPVWTRTRGTANKNIVTGLETELNALQPNLTQDVTGGKPRWWNDAMTLGHLEVRMRAAVLLDSAAEYKSFLLMYAKKIADEGYKSKGEELVRELYGPVY
jgi:protein HIRA/HIR1